MDHSFGRLSATLSEHLGMDECRKLCLYFDLPPAKRSDILEGKSPGVTLLEHLGKDDIIVPGDFSKLEKALKELQCASAAVKEIEKYHQAVETTESPEDDSSSESDEDSDTDDEYGKPDIQDVMEDLGLHKTLVEKLKLHDFLKIKDQQNTKFDIGIVELFWQKLSSLDYRARSNHFLTDHISKNIRHISIKDFIFIVMHCSDKFLRQDIIEKLSACQLAVPVVLKGIQGSCDELLTWSLRRIVKKWREQNSLALEEHVLKFPMYTVSFIRVGEITGVSKSDILNTLLGPWQGNGTHSYFLSRKNDPSSSGISRGCVEAIWYIPMKSNSEEKLKKVTLFLNLRGDSSVFTSQTKFLCRASNLTIALVAKQKRKNYKRVLSEITAKSNACIVVNINEERRKPSKKKPNFEWQNNCMLNVRFLNDESKLCDELHSKISLFRKKCTSMELRSVENMAEFCGKEIEVEDADDPIQEAKDLVKELCPPTRPEDLSEYKKQSFPLQPIWKEWVKADKQRLKPSPNNVKTVEELREDILTTKKEKRKLQLGCGLSDTAKAFSRSLKKVKGDSEALGYFATFLREKLFQWSDENVRNHLSNIAQMKEEISKLNVNEKDETNSNTEDETQQSNESQATRNRHRKKVINYKEVCQREYQQCKDKTIGWQHYVRELGQWYEAHADLNHENLNVDVVLLPRMAAGLLENGHSIEIMDGDTGHLPISWVTSVLDQLAVDLKNPCILVLSIVGVQSSGKSTLLNSMFGVRFPVRAGRCTRGLFLRLIQLEERYAQEVGFQYIFLIDSEGIRSLERTEQDGCRFDNELVTLALCVSDLTILNIEGENIGPDMTGLLQIAAHAMIRMKEVDLTSQCRIIQQRVSDINARERNMVNMERVIHILNEATIVAATEEGFAERYQQFSDVFDLRFDADLQFIPCLWTGSMSPPNPIYGDIVTELKKNIFKDVELNKLNCTLTVETFTHRIRDVWRAVKSENFLFNFEDSVKAVDFNNLSIQLNEWIIEMRTDIRQKLAVWRRRLQGPKSSDDNILELMQKECYDELQNHKTKVEESFESYISGHERQNALRKFSNRINQTLNDTVKDIEMNVRSVLKEDNKNGQLHRDVLDFVENVRNDLLEFIKMKRNSSRKEHIQHEIAKNKETGNPSELFTAIWKQHMDNVPTTKQPTEAEIKSLEAVCEQLLISVTRETAVLSEIEYLMKTEGGIQRHKDSPTWTEYFPHKGGRKHVEEWFAQYGKTLQDIIDKPIEDMEEESTGKRFDPNLFQLLLQKTLQKLSSVFKASEPPYLLKGKALLHMCGRLHEVALQRLHNGQDKNHIETFIEKERQALLEEFTALLTEESHADKVGSYLKSLFTDWLKDLTLSSIKTSVIRHCTITCKLGEKTSLIRFILYDLCQRNSLDDYLAYIHKQKQFIKNWVNNDVVKKCSELTVAGTVFQQIVAESVLISVEILNNLVTGISTDLKVKHFSAKDKSAYCADWVHKFVEELSKRGLTRGRELTTFLREYHISDLDNFVKELKLYIQNSLKDDIEKQLELPTHQNEKKIRKYIFEKLFDDPSAIVLERVCLEQCPICKAACENSWQTGSYHEHTSSTHIPRGIGGIISHKTKQLLLHDCLTCVTSPHASFQMPADGAKLLCKDYKKGFPNWTIKPQNAANYEKYWKFVMVRLNQQLAAHYKCEPARIPPSWKQITKSEVLSSLMTSKTVIPYSPGATLNMLMPELASNLQSMQSL
ncbi:Interferon-induced very large GTPase 1 [Holothuria leucospilota]|uniref:Interferon-induced very large GTPase 1 n=1 Tax=Holothuria leucospilota TaxID=206669 RepID=A0A9Q1BS15_HOLLE|nr:Interferon-induced very large GTPase 1 [Holothuria leucospilota]